MVRAGGRGGAPGVVRAWCGARLGARNPASPYISVSFAPSPPRFFARGRLGVVRAWPAPSWCTKSRRPLYLRSLCTKSPAFLRPWPAPTWCTKTRRPLYLLSLCTKSPAFFRPWPAGVVPHRPLTLLSSSILIISPCRLLQPAFGTTKN